MSTLGTLTNKRERSEEDAPCSKRSACAGEGRAEDVSRGKRSRQEQEEEPEEQLELSIHVKWISVTGRAKISELPLRVVKETSGQVKLSGLHRRLWARAFPQQPEDNGSTSSSGLYGSADAYARFGTCEEVLNLPMDVVNTSFKLMAMGPDGWQYCLHEMGAPNASSSSDAAPNMHVTAIEFESIARIIGHLGIRMQMVAYPIVSVHREWLWDTIKRMQADSNFQGILS